MHDIKAIRADPEEFDAAMARRGSEERSSRLLQFDAIIRDISTDNQELQAQRNTVARQIAQLRAAGKTALNEDDKTRADRAHEEAKLSQISTSAAYRLDTNSVQEKKVRDALADLLQHVPNSPAAEVPDGLHESSNQPVHERGTKLASAYTPLEHDAIALRLGYDPDAAAAIAGSRFAVLKGQLARLHRALGQFMLDVQTTEHGYTEVNPPLLVREAAMFGTGQLPKFAEDSFRTTDDKWLIPTAEVSLTNLMRERILDAKELPLRFTALTPCFRSEAGAAGKDTRGLIRQHQFEKVELVSIVHPDMAADEHERMTRCAEAVLEKLGLPYRRMLLCAGDMGFSARKTYDLEVWLPGAGTYREISSCSDCGDFQARRMDARFKTAGEKGTKFVHTLNGSGLAVGRTLVAVLENYQEADGSVRVPDAVLPYMGGVERLVPDK